MCLSIPAHGLPNKFLNRRGGYRSFCPGPQSLSQYSARTGCAPILPECIRQRLPYRLPSARRYKNRRKRQSGSFSSGVRCTGRTCCRPPLSPYRPPLAPPYVSLRRPLPSDCASFLSGTGLPRSARLRTLFRPL